MADTEADNAPSSSRRDFEQDVILRARRDPEFRKALVDDPRAAIQAAYGMEIPPDVDIQVLEETASKFYLVLPFESEELSDADLAAVAGGVGLEAAKWDQLRASAASVRMR